MTAPQNIVLIRGLLRDARHWGTFKNCLQSQFPHATIFTPDIPGNGHLYQQTSPACIPDMTDALRQQVSMPGPFKLIALSMGGMIAIDWMTRYPDEITDAVLVNTSVRPISPFYQRMRWTIYPAIIRMMLRSGQQREAHILALTSNRHADNATLLSTWQTWQQACPVSTYSALNQLYAAARFSVTSKPKQPTLIISSKGDRLVSAKCSQQLAQSWQTKHIQHETAGHDLPLDEPIWLADVIKQPI